MLDDSFFEYIKLAKKLKPKVVIAENVKGLLLGNAKAYARRIKLEFEEAGYNVQLFLLNAANMGVPQRRERVFFVCLRKDLAKPLLYQKDMFTQVPKLELNFNEKEIPFKEIYDGKGKPITDYKLQAWKHRKPTDKGIADSKEHAGMKVSDFNHVYLFKDKVMPTITGKADHAMSLFDEPIKPSDTELRKGGTYPLDYKYNSSIGYLVGMSVPPVMTAQIAHEIYLQWFKTEGEQNG